MWTSSRSAEARRRTADFAGLPPADLVQALLIRYDPGAGIGWHKDRPTFEHVVGLSLGSPAAMRFRRRRGERFERAAVPLEPRGAYHLSGEARHEWEHSIAERDQTRWSVTFRSMRDRAGLSLTRATSAGVPPTFIEPDQIAKAMLLEVAVVAACAIEPDVGRTAITSRLTRNAGVDFG